MTPCVSGVNRTRRKSVAKDLFDDRMARCRSTLAGRRCGRRGPQPVRQRDEPLEPDGMHTTPTVDYGLVLQDEIVLELDDGQCTQLSAGDIVIQNGTRHAWRNRSDKPVTMAFVLIGTNRDG